MSEFIYILENSSMPGLVKIGRTDRSVSERVNELSSHTGVPTGFTVVREYSVINSVEAERIIHERLSAYRVSNNREFFKLDAEDAADIIESILETVKPKPRRDFAWEDEIVARALPIVVKAGMARPRMLEEMLSVSYEEALFVIQQLQVRGVIDEHNISVWKAIAPNPVPERQTQNSQLENEIVTEQQKEKLRFFGCTWDEGITEIQAKDALKECAKQFPEAEAAYQRGLSKPEPRKDNPPIQKKKSAFPFSNWIHAFADKRRNSKEKSPQESILERRAQDLEKQAKQLQKQVTHSGLGADLQPMPERTVRDLSVPHTKGPHIRKTAVPNTTQPSAVAQTPIIGNYQLPSLDFLQLPDMAIMPTESKEKLMANARLMQRTLAQFDIEVSLGDITRGPTITRYELHPAPGVRLEDIAALSNKIAAALRAEEIAILTPIPSKGCVGVDVPNVVKTKVIIRDLLESDEWRNTKAKIPLALGKDIYGHPIIADLTEMPHMLIAGNTGSGKSICIHSIIASLLFRFSPDQLRFIMIDPKVVELQFYNALPHLVVPVVTDPKKAILALRWAVNEMEKRYQLFGHVGTLNIGAFNARPHKKIVSQEPELRLMSKKEKVEPGAETFTVEVDEEIVVPQEEDIVIPEKLSYIFIAIENAESLMQVAPEDMEMAIARITQMGRPAGIHLILTMQPGSQNELSEKAYTGIPARIAFRCASRIESRSIIGTRGAEKLLGKGDMFYLLPGSAKLIRAQGALITDQEIQNIVGFIAKQAKPNYDMETRQQLFKQVATDNPSGTGEDEELIQACVEVIRSEQKASVPLLQRRLRLGYTRAARIMDELENRGIVGPNKGAEPRDILIDLNDYGADGAGREAV